MKVDDLAPLTEGEPVPSALYTEQPETFDRFAFYRGALLGLILGAGVWALVALVWWLL